MTAQPHTMTAHDTVPYDVYGEDVLRQYQQAGGSINEHHFRILLSKCHDAVAALQAQINEAKESAV